MHRYNLKTILLVAGILILLLPAISVLAKDKVEKEKKCKHLILGDEFENITINADGPELTITMTENGKTKVTVVDMEQVGFMVGESVSEMAEVLSEMQMEFRVGNENGFTFALEDEEWEIDLNEIISEVSVALDGAFEDMDTDDWGHHRHYRSMDGDDEKELREDLQEELTDLRQELKAMKKELARLKKAK